MSQHAISVDAVVIKVNNFSDNDRYIELLTRDRGIISVLCKSIKSRNRRFINLTDLYTYAKFELFDNNGKYYFDSADSIYDFASLRTSLTIQTAAAHMTELVHDFILSLNDVSDEIVLNECIEIYRLFTSALFFMDQTNGNELFISSIFTYKFLSLMGYALNFDLQNKGHKLSTETIFSDFFLEFSFSERRFVLKKKNFSTRDDLLLTEKNEKRELFYPKEESNFDNKSTDTVPIGKGLFRSLQWIDAKMSPDCYKFSISAGDKHLLYLFVSRYLREQVEKEYKKLDLIVDLYSLINKGHV